MDRQVGCASYSANTAKPALTPGRPQRPACAPSRQCRHGKALRMTNGDERPNVPEAGMRQPEPPEVGCPAARRVARSADAQRSAAPAHRLEHRSGRRRARLWRTMRPAVHRCRTHVYRAPTGIMFRQDDPRPVSSIGVVRRRRSVPPGPTSPHRASRPRTGHRVPLSVSCAAARRRSAGQFRWVRAAQCPGAYRHRSSHRPVPGRPAGIRLHITNPQLAQQGPGPPLVRQQDREPGARSGPRYLAMGRQQATEVFHPRRREVRGEQRQLGHEVSR